MKNAMQLKSIIKNMSKEKGISAQLVMQNFVLQKVTKTQDQEIFMIFMFYMNYREKTLIILL